jgi:hypothetical protein
MMKETLKQYSDDDLKGLIAEAQAILRARDKHRKEDALRQIRAIASAHGLSIEAKTPAKKRGRPSRADKEDNGK